MPDGSPVMVACVAPAGVVVVFSRKLSLARYVLIRWESRKLQGFQVSVTQVGPILTAWKLVGAGILQLVISVPASVAIRSGAGSGLAPKIVAAQRQISRRRFLIRIMLCLICRSLAKIWVNAAKTYIFRCSSAIGFGPAMSNK